MEWKARLDFEIQKKKGIQKNSKTRKKQKQKLLRKKTKKTLDITQLGTIQNKYHLVKIIPLRSSYSTSNVAEVNNMFEIHH